MILSSRLHSSFNLTERHELFTKIQSELLNRYSIDEKLALEMACDFIEVLTAVDGDFVAAHTLDKKIALHHFSR